MCYLCLEMGSFKINKLHFVDIDTKKNFIFSLLYACLFGIVKFYMLICYKIIICISYSISFFYYNIIL